MPVHAVTEAQQVRALAAWLNDPSRDRTVVLITSARGCAPFIDPEQVAGELGDCADVHVMATGDLSWQFADAMPSETGAYGGAGRTYPPGTAWVQDLRAAPLRFAHSPAEGLAAQARVIADAFSVAGAGSASSASSRRATPATLVSATVLGTPTSSRALAELADGRTVAIVTASVFPDLNADRVLRKGLVVRGALDARAGFLSLAGHVPAPHARVAALSAGSVVPVQVARVSAGDCTVRLLPGAEVEVSRDSVTGNPRDDLSDLLSPGEVVLARVSPGAAWPPVVSMLDIDDSTVPEAALSIWPGGPAWLEWPVVDAAPPATAPPVAAPGLGSAGRAEQAGRGEQARASGLVIPKPGPRRPGVPSPSKAPETVPTSTPAPAPAPAPDRPVVPRPAAPPAVVQELQRGLISTQEQLHVLRAELAEREATLTLLNGQLDRMGAENASLRTELLTKDEELRKLRTRHRKSLNTARRNADGAGGAAKAEQGFADAVEQFRWEVYREWVVRVPAGEKAERPLGEYTLGPDFLKSLDEVEGVSRAKVTSVVVEVLTGLAPEIAARKVHRLRTGPGGDDPEVRDGDAVCMRVSLQTNTPSARRLHYWQHPDHIVLSRVALHDDFTP